MQIGNIKIDWKQKKDIGNNEFRLETLDHMDHYLWSVRQNDPKTQVNYHFTETLSSRD